MWNEKVEMKILSQVKVKARNFLVHSLSLIFPLNLK